MQEKTSLHKLFLPAGLLLLVAGSWGIANYFRLHGPGDDQLHELALRNVSKVTEQPDISGGAGDDSIWLETTNNARIRYRNRFPQSTEVRRLYTNLSLLLDSSNRIWAVKNADGTVLARRYFEEENIEKKATGKVSGPIFAALGGFLLFLYYRIQRDWHSLPEAERAKLEVDAQKLRMGLGLLGALIGYSILAHWLLKFLPGSVVSLGWLVCGVIVMALISMKGRPPVG